jgi:4-hydroxy-tetrahydrodipicolinate synthase
MEQNSILRGVWPAMLTPLHEDRSIDWHGVDSLVEWYIEAGVTGLFAVGQSGEMFALDDEERLKLASHVVKRAAERVPVVASGTFAIDVQTQAAFVRRMFDTGVQAVTVITGQLASPNEDDDCLSQRVETLMGLTESIPLALYECPLPYHRVLPPELVGSMARTNRFHLYKETSRSLERVMQKVSTAAGTPLQIFNADATTLLASLRAGASGYCGIAANFYPDLVVWLCTHFDTDPEQAEAVQNLLTALDPVIHFKYPVSAKYFHQHNGCNMLTLSRVTDVTLDDYDMRVIDAIAHHVTRCRVLVT